MVLKRNPGDFVFQIPIPRGVPNAKVGQNAPCPCGSGRKFKKCCRDAVPGQISIVPAALVEEVERQSRQHQARLREHRKNYGHARETVHTKLKGRRFVVIGNRIHYPRAGREWVTFHDFLMDYVNGSFGPKWGTAEDAKSATDRHPVYPMFEDWFDLQRRHIARPGEIIKTEQTGDVASLLTLAHDLFTVGDNAKLQDRLLTRLRHRDQYQGARYELFVIATCVRAGFSVDYEDETDGSKKHVELIATHKKTGLKIAIEAKSRHRDGILGFRGQRVAESSAREPHRAGLRRLLTDAAIKEPKLPYVVFVDVNLSDSAGIDGRGPDWHREVWEKTLPTLPVTHQGRINMVLCTNITFHRAGRQILRGTTFFSAYNCIRPEFPIDRSTLDALVEAAKLFQNVPHLFPGEAEEGSGAPVPSSDR